MELYYAAKGIFQLVMFGLFLGYFGLPSYHRYQDKEVLVNLAKTGLEDLRIPAVTICPRYRASLSNKALVQS